MNFGSVAVSRQTSKTPSTEIDRLALQDLERDDLQSRFMRPPSVGPRASSRQHRRPKQESATGEHGAFRDLPYREQCGGSQKLPSRKPERRVRRPGSGRSVGHRSTWQSGLLRGGTGETLRSDRHFDSPRELHKGGNDSGAEINAVIDKQGAKRFIASPQISVRKIHRMNKINCV